MFCEPASGERLLHAGGDKDTAFTVFIVAGMTLVHELKLSLAKGTRISSALPIANTTLVYAGDPNKSYSGTSGDLEEDGQQAFETRGLRDLNFVDQGGNEVVGVLEGVADIVQTFYEEAGTLVDVVRGAIEFAVDSLVFGHVADEFIVHKKDTS